MADLFPYNADAPLDLREVGARAHDGVRTRLFTYLTPQGVRRSALLIKPDAPGPFPGILYVHWYDSEAGNSNRRQFNDEAAQMAQSGAACLMIETMWSDRDWFIKRTQAEDYEASRQEVAALRRAMDLLLADSDVDASKVAYVGHDFGGMYGMLMGKADRRASMYIILAATPRLSDWYLYYPRLEEAERQAFIAKMQPLDPITHVADLAPAPILFQFAKNDFHVPVERAEAFYAAAADPKEIQWFDAEHELNDEARQQRMAWLREKLRLSANGA